MGLLKVVPYSKKPIVIQSIIDRGTVKSQYVYPKDYSLVLTVAYFILSFTVHSNIELLYLMCYLYFVSKKSSIIILISYMAH